MLRRVRLIESAVTPGPVAVEVVIICIIEDDRRGESVTVNECSAVATEE